MKQLEKTHNRNSRKAIYHCTTKGFMKKHKRKKSAHPTVEPTSDENFQFIAGYTNSGFPYGITWEEAKLIEEGEKLKAIKKEERITSERSSVDLNELIDAFTMQSHDITYYVNRKSGEIVQLIQGMMEEDEIASEILCSDDYISLPSSYELDKYTIMEEFVFSLQDIKIQEVLACAISGKGAFGRFKETIKKYGIEDQWYEYQHEQLQKKAIEWCRQNGLYYGRT